MTGLETGVMTSRRLESAASQLEQINESTSVELEELKETIDSVERLHEEHIREMEDDREFIEDLKALYREIEQVRKIEKHMYNAMEAYDSGELTKAKFKQLYVRDEESLVDVIGEIRTELEESIRLISEEERLTNKDEDKEAAIEELVDALTHEEAKLEEAHGNIEEILLG